jgi:DNA-binding NarL/FixJ family response regulator
MELGYRKGSVQEEAREEGIEIGMSQDREEILKLLEQGLSIEEIRERFKQKEETLN